MKLKKVIVYKTSDNYTRCLLLNSPQYFAIKKMIEAVIKVDNENPSDDPGTRKYVPLIKLSTREITELKKMGS